MPTLEFDDQVNRIPQRKATPPGIIGLLMRLKLAKTERSANLLLIAFVVIGLTVTFILLRSALAPLPAATVAPL